MERSRIGQRSTAVLLLGMALRAGASPAAAPQSSDSLQILDDARHAQRDFEQRRRAGLPYDWDNRGRGVCELRIGRFCYWYHPSPDRPPEPENIGRERARLLDELAAAARQLPGDDWILGQRVRYLVEAHRIGAAVALSQTCGGTRWWCDALEGFARHVGGDHEGAGPAFARALRGMDEKRRCEWADLSAVLDDDEYPKLTSRIAQGRPCTERLAAADRIWWLADPLYSLPGNDLESEHYARHTMALLLEHADNTYGMAWGSDLRELLLRFGWPTHWARSFRAGSLDPSSPVVGHEPDPSFWFFPRPLFSEPWSDLTRVHWEPAMERPPSRYAPPYATGITSLGGVQVARFRRGDSTLTVAALDLTADSGFVAGPVDVRLAAARDPETRVEVGGAMLPRPFGVVVVRSGWRPAVLSLEVMKGQPGLLGRQRVLLPPDPGGLAPALSDILLLLPKEDLPRSLDEAAGAALRPARVRVGQRVGLYWEMYDLPNSVLEVAVTVTKTRSKREPLYPVGRPECPPRVASLVTARWQEQPESRPRDAARSLMLDLRRLKRGRYLVAVQISEAGRPRGCSSREVEIVE